MLSLATKNEHKNASILHALDFYTNITCIHLILALRILFFSSSSRSCFLVLKGTLPGCAFFLVWLQNGEHFLSGARKSLEFEWIEDSVKFETPDNLSTKIR